MAVKEYYPSGLVSRHPGAGSALTWYKTGQAVQARQAGMEMFLKEARKMSVLEDIPGIVRVRELFQENETAYIVMDFVEGRTLKAWLGEKGPMSWEEAKDIFLPAIQIMEQVHQAGLVHRDLSPDNLMLTPDGKVRILDLGAAKDLNINSGASSMQVAKKGFSPLEQYGQRGGSGSWTDVYAMAATIYYTLTGVLPPAAVDRLERDTLDWAHPRLHALPDHVLDALKNAMAVLSKDRTQSMAELEQALFTAPPAQPAPTPKKFPVKKWLLPAIAAVAAVLGAALWLTRPTYTVQDAREAAGPSDWRNNVLRRFSGDITDPMGFGDIDRERVRSVTFLDTLADAPSNSVDISDSQDGSVWMWSEASGSLLDRYYDLYIAGNGGVNGEVACKYLFYECTNLQSVDFGQSFHVETATDMSGMFQNCPALTSLDVAGWDTSSVTDMSWMFYNCGALAEPDLSGWDTSSVTDMSYMFSNCGALAEPDLSRWDTSSVTDMSHMFSNCAALTNLDAAGWDTSSVTDMRWMFYSCGSLTDPGLSGWDTSSVTDMAYMFSSCGALTDPDLSGWDVSAVTDHEGFMGSDATINGRPWEDFFLNPSHWQDNVLRSSVGQNGEEDFGGIQREQIRTVTFLDTLADAPADSVDVSEDLNGSVLLWEDPNDELFDLYIAGEGGVNGEAACRYMFYGCTNLQLVDFNQSFHTETSLNMYEMFGLCRSLSELDLSGFDTSSVMNMSRMFYGCDSLSELDLSGFDTSSVTDMSEMFYSCESLSELDLSGFDTSSVTDMRSMFAWSSALTALDLSGWDTSSVTNMQQMFQRCGSLADLRVYKWNTSAVTDMSWMFHDCKSLTKLNLSGWDISNVTDYRSFLNDGMTVNGRPWRDFFKNPSKWYGNVLRSSGTYDDLADFGGIQREQIRTVTFLDTLANAPADSVDVSESQNGSVLLWAEANGDLYDLYIAGEGGINGEAACHRLFEACKNLQSVDFGRCFHTESTTDMGYMFFGCSSLESLDLSRLNTFSVTDMSYMFKNCPSLTDVNLSGWDISSVVAYENFMDDGKIIDGLDWLYFFIVY